MNPGHLNSDLYSDILQHYRALVTRKVVTPLATNVAAQEATRRPFAADWLESTRERARGRAQSLDLPSRKDEPWHYASLNRLYEQPFSPATEDDETVLSYNDIAHLVVGGENGLRIVLQNGQFCAALSNLPDTEGLQICRIRDLMKTKSVDDKHRIASLSDKDSHLFSAMNTALISDGAYIRVAKNAVIEQPIELLHVSIMFSSRAITQPRNLVILEQNASATLVESYASLGDLLYFNNVVNEIFIDEGASLKHDRLQDESPRAFHLNGLHVRQEKDSNYQSTSATLGAAWSRTEFNVDLAGNRARSNVNGLYIADNNQVNDTHLNVVHGGQGGNSTEFFKGLVKDHGKAVFDGTVTVQKNAQQTDAQLKNANLLLSREAEIDTKPVLQIHADDVKCSHGTTVGQIDQDMLFYLRTRGVPENKARKLICLGFAGDVIDKLSWKPLRKRAHGILQKRFDEIPAIASIA